MYGVVVMWREPGARTWEPSIVPVSERRDAATPVRDELVGPTPGGSGVSQVKRLTMFMRISTTSMVSANPKSSDSVPMRNGGIRRRKNRIGGSVIV